MDRASNRRPWNTGLLGETSRQSRSALRGDFKVPAIEPARDDQGFLDLYLEYTKNTESPLEFNFWCGLFGISVALGRRSWVEVGMNTVYPNLYAVLIAESGVQRKSSAIRYIKQVLKGLEPP